MTDKTDKIRATDHAMALIRGAAFTSEDGVFTWADEARAADLMKGRPDDVPQSLKSLLSCITDEKGRSDRAKAIASLTWDGAPYRVTYRARSFCGDSVWVEERGKRLAGNGRTPTHICGLLRDVDSEMRERETAGYNASYDALTGLWNDKRLHEALKWQIAACRRYSLRAALLTIQVSNLDDINQSYGFEAGDRLLKGIAKRLSDQVRAPDHTARLTGPGFDGVVFGLVIGQDAGAQERPDEHHAIAERFIQTLTDIPYTSPYGDLYANLAISAVNVPSQADSAFEAMDKARIALDHSLAREGKFVPWHKDLIDLTEHSRKAPIEADDIIDALNSRNIRLAYQPIVHSRSRKPHHYECLLRLQRPDGQVVPAGNFIMAAETLGLVHLLDRRDGCA